MRTALCALVILAVAASAASIKWTGYAGNNQWTTNNNWYPNQVPGPNDDVTIDAGVVQVTIPTGVNSLVMGTQVENPANLTIFQSFYVGNGGMNVEENGNLFLPSGSSMISGTVNVGGAIFFTSGVVSGAITVSRKGNAYLNGGGEKTISGCQFTVNGPVVLGGVIGLNMSSVFQVTSTAVGSGNLQLQAQDKSQGLLFDSSQGTLTYQGGGTFTIAAPVNLGTFNFMGGNLTLMSTVSFAGSLTVPQKSFVVVVSGSTNLTAGLYGNGVFTSETAGGVTLGALNFTGALNLLSGPATFTSAGYVSILTFQGGSAVLSGSGVMANQLNLLSGTIYGPNSLSANNVWVNTRGFNLNTGLTVSGTMTTSGTCLFSFNVGSFIKITQGASVNTGGSLQFVGAPDSGYFRNDGTVNANNQVSFSNIPVSGSGSFNVAGTLSTTAITFAQASVSLTGNGVFKGLSTQLSNLPKVVGSPSVRAVIGKYTLYCPKECDNISTDGTPSSTFNFSR